ncbi:MAG TPA: ABC transporter permease subunit [Ruminiclostridium sp.]
MRITPAALEKVALSPKTNKKKSGFLKEVSKNRVLFIMMLPALVVLFLNNYLPMAGILIAFKNFKFFGRNFFENFYKSDWVGLQNFEFFTSTPDAFMVTRNTLAYNLAFIVIGLVVAVFFAVILNEVRNKYLSKFYQASMFLPYFMSWIVVSYLVFALLSEEQGFVNKNLLPAFGISIDSLPAWYGDPAKWPVILTAVNMWKFTGYNCVVYVAAIAGIDQEYYEAATVDGATKFQQIRNITLPLLTPLMIILTLLAVGRVFYSDFGLFFSVTRNVGALYDTTLVIDTFVYNALRNMNDVGMASAAGLYQSLCGFVLVLTSNLIVRKIDPDKALF